MSGNSTLLRGFKTFELARIAKLKDEKNYPTWASNMKMQFQLQDLWPLVQGLISAPKDTDQCYFQESDLPPKPIAPAADASDEEKAEFQRLSQAYATAVEKYNKSTQQYDHNVMEYEHSVKLAAIIIKSSLEDGPHSRVINCDDPVYLWKHLASAYSGNSIPTEMILKRKIINTKFDGVSSITHFFDQFMADIQHIRLMDSGLRDRDTTLWLINSMPDCYTALTGTIIKGLKEFGPQTLETIISEYTQEYQRLKGDAEVALNSQAQRAHNTQVQKQSSSENKIVPRERNKYPPCSYCSKQSHLPPDCWKAYPEKHPSKRVKKDEDALPLQESTSTNTKKEDAKAAGKRKLLEYVMSHD